MHHLQVIFHHVSFAYDTASGPLLSEVSAHFPRGWTGIVGANGAGKTTLLRLATGELTPHRGTIEASPATQYCPQRTDDPPPLLAEFLDATDAIACALKGQLGIADGWGSRWQTLSHGERKRAQIGVALWQQPDVLAVDEPTNHLDAEARQLLLEALQSFAGVGLLVSHDRALLDGLCQQCLFLEPPNVTMRPGGVTQGLQLAVQEAESQRTQAELLKRERRRLERETAERKHEVALSPDRLSKRGLDPKDHAARGKINLARLTGKDSGAGRRLRQMQSRYSRRNTLLTLASGSLPLGQERRLYFPDLVVRPRDRIALTGPNGGGKSTLVRHLVGVLDLPAEQVLYIPQEIDARTARDLLARVRTLPKSQLGHVMTIVSRLGSRPHRLLETLDPSPGEARKLLLALGITQVPHVIIMDEPTNHLDLPSLQCLEAALRECPCGLILVSHDQYFLDRLTTISWQIAPRDASQNGDTQLHILALHEPLDRAITGEQQEVFHG
jgi:ATPase subunit of ABC transporter with duplicated ATPase domains